MNKMNKNGKGLLGERPRLEYHSPDVLVIDARYQRTIETYRSRQLINTIVTNFRWSWFGVLIATDNGDGTYCVVDGQHRAEAARRHPAVDAVPVMVIEEMTLQEQARAFIQMNAASVKMTQLAIFNAKCRAGDEDARAISEACAAEGVTIPRYQPPPRQQKPGELYCIKAAERIYKQDGALSLRCTLKIVGWAYEMYPGSFSSSVLKAVAGLVKLGEWPDEVVAKYLSKRDGDEWLTTACKWSQGEGSNYVALKEMLAEGLRRKAAA